MEPKSSSERFAKVIETAKNNSSSGAKPMQSEDREKQFSEIRKLLDLNKNRPADKEASARLVDSFIESIQKNTAEVISSLEKQDKKLMEDTLDAITKLQFKTVEEFKDSLKDINDLAAKMIARSESGGPKEFGNIGENLKNQTLNERFKAEGVTLEGKEDTVVNRMKNSFFGASKEPGKEGQAVGLKEGIKNFGQDFKTGFKEGLPKSGMMGAIFNSHTSRREEIRNEVNQSNEKVSEVGRLKELFSKSINKKPTNDNNKSTKIKIESEKGKIVSGDKNDVSSILTDIKKILVEIKDKLFDKKRSGVAPSGKKQLDPSSNVKEVMNRNKAVEAEGEQAVVDAQKRAENIDKQNADKSSAARNSTPKIVIGGREKTQSDEVARNSAAEANSGEGGEDGGGFQIGAGEIAAGVGIAGAFGAVKKFGGGLLDKAKNFIKNKGVGSDSIRNKGFGPEQLLDKNGKPLSGAAKQSRIDKLIKDGVAPSTGETAKANKTTTGSTTAKGNKTTTGSTTAAAPKKPGMMSKLGKLGKFGKIGGALSLLTAGLEFSGRKEAGQSNTKAAVGTAGGVAGGLAGASAGAMAGGAIGALFGGVGAVPGAAIGGILGGIGGAFGGGAIADKGTEMLGLGDDEGRLPSTKSKLETGNNAASGNLKQMTESAKENSAPVINVPPPTVIQQPAPQQQNGGGSSLPLDTVRTEDSSWQRFQNRRSFG